jgi:hypothetical protein
MSFGLMIGFIGLFDVALDYTIYYPLHTHTHTHTHTSSLAVALQWLLIAGIPLPLVS